MDRQARLHHDPGAGPDRFPRDHRAAVRGPVALALALGFVAGCLGLSACGGGTGGATASSPGEQVFRDQGCGSCHRLAAGGGSGTAGPALDGKRESAARVRRFVMQGGKGMLAYRDKLSAQQIDALVKFVVNASR